MAEMNDLYGVKFIDESARNGLKTKFGYATFDNGILYLYENSNKTNLLMSITIPTGTGGGLNQTQVENLISNYIENHKNELIGPKGDTGDRGPVGPQGPAGEPGSTNAADIKLSDGSTVEAAVGQINENLNQLRQDFDNADFGSNSGNASIPKGMIEDLQAIFYAVSFLPNSGDMSILVDGLSKYIGSSSEPSEPTVSNSGTFSGGVIKLNGDETSATMTTSGIITVR